jgi:hypothetical protein
VPQSGLFTDKPELMRDSGSNNDAPYRNGCRSLLQQISAQEPDNIVQVFGGSETLSFGLRVFGTNLDRPARCFHIIHYLG